MRFLPAPLPRSPQPAIRRCAHAESWRRHISAYLGPYLIYRRATGKDDNRGAEIGGYGLLMLSFGPCLLQSAAHVGVVRTEGGLQMLGSRVEGGAGFLHLALGLQSQPLGVVGMPEIA